MARNAEALKVQVWGENADTLQTPEAAGLVRDDGWPDGYGVDLFPQLGVFNQIWREFSAALVDVARYGVLPWDAAQRYEHDPVAYTVASDGRIYQSVQSSGGTAVSRNPILDTTSTYWRPVIDTTSGRLAPVSNADLEGGTNNQDFLTAAALLSLFQASPNARWRATPDLFGLARFGTRTQIEASNTDRAVNGEVFMQIIDDLDIPTVPDSSTTERGIIRTATEQEGRDGTATGPAMTPATTTAAIEEKTGVNLVDRTSELAIGAHDFTVANIANYETLEFLVPETDRAHYGRVPRTQFTAATLYLVDSSTDSLYSVNPATGAATLIGALNGPTSPQGLASHNSILYLADTGSSGRLYSVNPATGAATLIGALNGPTSPQGLASHNGTLYLVDSNVDRLYSVNPNTGAATQVGNLGVSGSPRGLASHSGTLYLVDSSTDSLYSVNPATGAATLIGSLNIGAVAPTGLASHSGTLYLVDSSTDSLYSVNPNAGAATQVGNLNGPTVPNAMASLSGSFISESLRASLSGTTLTLINSRALPWIQVNGLN